MTTLHAVSTFSGIGGIDLAFHRVGVPGLLMCEADKSARAVLSRRFPGIPIHPDIKELTADDLRAAGAVPDRTVIHGGFPCQDLSVAGRRRGMGEGTRSGLFWELARLVADFRPRWVVLENVPGLLSSRGGRDMGAVLGTLADLGYGYAYRVLDAQHFGVPQRRPRVVIVGHLGAPWGAPAQVLLEPEGGSESPAQVGSARPGAAQRPENGIAGGGITPPLTAHHGLANVGDEAFVTFQKVRRTGERDAPFDLTSATRAVDVVVSALTAHGVGTCGADDNQAQSGHIITFDPKAGGDRTSSGAFETGTGIAPVLSGARPHAACISGSVAHALTAEGCDAGEDGSGRGMPIVASALTAGVSGRRQEDDYNLASEGAEVRRLTPLECERLQGYPDGWTDGQADSPRYRQLGNSVAVPVFEWVARRLVAVDAALIGEAAA